MMKQKIRALAVCLLALLTPAWALADDAAQTVFRIDGAAFVDSLQYMLKGMVGIFLVTALIILVLVILEKATKKQEKED